MCFFHSPTALMRAPSRARHRIVVDAAQRGLLVELEDHVPRLTVPERDVLDGPGDFGSFRICHGEPGRAFVSIYHSFAAMIRSGRRQKQHDPMPACGHRVAHLNWSWGPAKINAFQIGGLWPVEPFPGTKTRENLSLLRTFTPLVPKFGTVEFSRAVREGAARDRTPPLSYGWSRRLWLYVTSHGAVLSA